MGYSVLYVAFVVVALWLLGEVLLQYKARLRWRVLAFAGFMLVVVGVYERQIAVIAAGAVAFGVGQSFVTLSYKRGFATGWAIGNRAESDRGRRKGPAGADPALEVGPVEPESAAPAPPVAAPAAAPAEAAYEAPAQPPVPDELAQGPAPVYQPMPMQDDSGEYPVFDHQTAYTADPYTSGGYEGYGAQGYDGWTGYDQQTGQQSGQQQGYQQGYEQGGYQEQPAASYDASGYGYGQQQGDWQQHQQQAQQPYPQQDGGYGYGYDQYGQQQPYIPQQQHQSPYEQQQGPYQPEQTDQPADPYDPYRY
jgi:hypothetical protein